MSSVRRSTAFDLSQTIYTAPQNRLDANRWLAMASFGAATAHTEIATSTKSAPINFSGAVDDATRLMSIGYSAWVTEQLIDNASTPTSIPAEAFTLTGFSTFGDLSKTSLSKLPAMNAFFWTSALHSSAQLRLKLAFALSQIFVTNSTATGTSPAANGPEIMAHFYGNLVKATLSNNTASYRTLIEDVTYSRAMPLMLSYLRNAKEDVATQKRPDENYAREILQLFSIGLKQLNQDGTVIKDSAGVELETYDPEDIPQVARFMTGLSDLNSTGAFGGTQSKVVPNHTLHETGAKTLFAYPGQSKVTFPAQLANSVELEYVPKRTGYAITVVDANTFTVALVLPNPYIKTALPIRYRLSDNLNAASFDGTVTSANGATTATITRTTHGRTTGDIIYSYGCVNESIQFLLDYIFNHPNVAPYISTALIKFFVTSNPPKEYIARISKVFNNNGSGVRGDLSAVVKAILLDREAIIPFGKNQKNHGRFLSFTEKTLRAMRGLRNDIVHVNYPSTVADENVGVTYNAPLFTKPRTLGDFKACANYMSGGDAPFTAPSVFNFHRPGFKPSGTKLSNLNLIAPEMQNLTMASATTWFNQICAACETRTPVRDRWSSGTSGLTDFRGGGARRGIDLAPHVDGYTVSAKTAGVSIAITGNKTLANSATSSTRIGYMKRRSDGQLYNNNGVALTVPTATGAAVAMTLSTGANAAPDLNDVLDLVPAFIIPSSGFGSTKFSEGTVSGALDFFPANTLFYRLANLVPNTAPTPTTGDLNPSIDYLQDILCVRPISAELRAVMVSAGQVAVTEPAHLLVGDATVNNHYANFYMTLAQKRARHMLVMLLASPEFISTN